MILRTDHVYFLLVGWVHSFVRKYRTPGNMRMRAWHNVWHFLNRLREWFTTGGVYAYCY